MMLRLFFQGEKALAGEQFNARNVDADRNKVINYANNVMDLCDEGKLTDKIVLLTRQDKPVGKLRYTDYMLRSFTEIYDPLQENEEDGGQKDDDLEDEE
jgi:hypothetical protein